MSSKRRGYSAHRTWDNNLLLSNFAPAEKIPVYLPAMIMAEEFNQKCHIVLLDKQYWANRSGQSARGQGVQTVLTDLPKQ